MSKKRPFHFGVRQAAKRSIVFLLALSLILSEGVPGARAADNILYVKPDGTGDCSSWENACTLQEALTNAVSGKQIWVSAGTYTPGSAGSDRTVSFQLKEGVAIYGGFAGTEALLSQRNWTTNVVILSGDLNGDDDGFTNIGENSYHVVRGATDASLDGVIIRGGNANGINPDNNDDGICNSSSNQTLSNVTYSVNTINGCGGGMHNENSSPTLTNVTFSGNSALYYGGGMHNDNSSPTLTNVIFSGNMTNGLGGGMSNLNFSSPMLNNVTFSENTGYWGGGGGMINSNYSSPTLSNVTFSGNTTHGYGGGMWNEFSSSPTLSNVTFSGNTAPYSGGGMYNTGSSNPTLSNVTFSGNSSWDDGGGMFNESSSPTLTNVTFMGNWAQYGGGGIYNQSSSPTLTNVTFSDNTTQYGGGMSNGSSSPTLINVTFSGNMAGVGGGMYNYDSSPTVRNSILWDDSGGEITNDSSSTPTVSISDVQGGYTGTGNIDADPLLAPLGNYGGGVQTIALLPGSPVIDAASSNCPDTDARGLERSFPSCDLGAFESQGFSLTKTGGDNQTTLTDTAFAQSLCVTMTANYAGEPLDGAKITFTPPASGASATLTSSLATIASGAACAGAIANGTGGSYNVTASTPGAASVTFSLTNIPKIYLPILLNLFR